MQPKAEQLIYKMEKANDSIELYRGVVEISQGNRDEKCNGTVSLDWDPFPQIRFHLFDVHVQFQTAQCEINIINLGIIEKGQISNINGMSGEVIGYFEEPIHVNQKGTPIINNIKYIIAHAANFTHYRGTSIQIDNYRIVGRMTLKSEKWSVTIDYHKDTDKLLKEIESKKNFAFSHVIRIERTDRVTFSAQDAENVIFCLCTFFSFICGYSTAACLPVGFDVDGQRIWELWSTPQLEPRSHGFSWFPERHVDHTELSQAFSRLAELWEDPDWKKAAQLAIYWYVVANESRSIEAAIMLYQVGLEVVCWYVLVEIIKKYPGTKFNRLMARQRIQELIDWAQIPSTIPDSLQALTRASNDNGWVVGPDVLSNLRNMATHPKKNSTDTLLTFSVAAKMEALALARWYLELSLLKALNYNGHYMNRVNGWNREVVPWKTDI